MAQSYNNRSLFSDYYLEELISQDSHWRSLKDKAWEFRQRISTVLEKAVPGLNGDTPEAEVERRLIRPILDVLGHVYFAQPPVPSPEGVRRPDYAFFPSLQARQEAESHKGKLEFFKTALAVGDAKAWERSLDKRVKGPGDAFSNHNPSYQIDFYLRATDKRWGLLTNGRHWRLYHRDLSYRLDVYYEVDLPQILTLDEDAFLYFLAFFHKEAFQPDGMGECFLDRSYRASTEYATRVSGELRDNVYEALRLLAEGFLSFPGNNLKPEDLDLIRENAFIVIYRLLFILYAEARGFLPVANLDYWGNYSLRALARDIAAKEPFDTKLHPTTTGYWSRLQDLFKLINNGDDFLHIPPYNGRLFDDQKEHRCLAAWKIGDRYLAAAIDQLARAKAAGRTGRGFISYRDLGIRELGSIYEGLLEHRPRYATQDMAVVREDKRERFIPVSKLGNRKALKTYPVGSVYLETDRGERKATGSYYTPDYIVKYIVSNTLGPLLEEAKKSGGNLIDAILSLKVLDPAMGSGHFLVEATDYLACALVEALGADPREVEEDEIRWARREVVERCIYGVDLNPLAVDLAKLSLWLSTVSLDKPLNFLDHHLRCGNSLIGARIAELGALPGKALKMKGMRKKPLQVQPSTMWEGWFIQNVATAVDNYFRIASLSSDTLRLIRDKEQLYDASRQALRRYFQVANIWTSTYFGNEVDPQDYENLLTNIRATDPEWAELEKQPWFARGVKTGEERRFFHWELEFPEVFFDRNGQRLPNPGFSAVVGNPPWDVLVGVESRPSLLEELQWYSSSNLFAPHLAGGRKNIYWLFCILGVALVNPLGWFSLIVPATLTTDSTTSGLRKLFTKQCSWALLVQLPEAAQVFGEVTQSCCVFVVRKGGDRSTPIKVALNVTTRDLDTLTLYEIGPDLLSKCSGELLAIPLALDDVVPNILKRIHAQPPLNLSFTVYQGEANLTFDKKYFLYTQASTRLIRGEHLQKYEVLPPVEGQPDWINLASFISELSAFKSDAVNRDRVVTQQVANMALEDRLKAAKVRAGPIIGNSCNALIPKGDHRSNLSYLVALLNSSLLEWRFKLFSSNNHINTYELETLPIRRINFTTPKAERERLVGEGKRLYQEYLQSKDWGKALAFVGQRLPRKLDNSPDTEREQSDVVHDLLAFLAEEMTRLHKEKQTEIKGFLTWLEGYLGVSVDDLKNKTKVREYCNPDVAWEGFLNALEQNRRAIQPAKGVDISRREPQEIVRREFDTSVAKLKPILETIELTDKLIDQIVYKLYGLTPEEIAVVEGTFKKETRVERRKDALS